MVDLRMFRVDGSGRDVELRGGTVALEAELQRRVEASMEAMLGVRFLASEYATGWHGGRVDSLGLDENGAPVVVEYKRGVDAGVMSQAVSYLGWLESARHEFEALVCKRLGAQVGASVDWRAPRVIVVAADFTRSDRDAIRRLGIPVDMVRYRVFDGGLLVLQLVESVAGARGSGRDRRPRWRVPEAVVDPTACGASVATEALVVPAGLADLYGEVAQVLGERDVEVRATRTYIAFRRIRNVATVVFRKKSGTILLYLRLCPDEVELVEGLSRDVRDVGHNGTGDLEVRIRSAADLERARPLIARAFDAA
ncbi:DUF5655 domain-containing protein [Streptomyces sp. NPDC090306]|uniref:DUF5655 domain-containing protein n=1 Tax=Streptomyces sp. NPDC090306 TaxID=3365961 RepID=UPI00382F4AD0